MTRAKVAVAVCAAAAIFVAGYASNGRSTGAAAVSAAKPSPYTCPMHPDYRSDGAGNCPVCGMRLVRAGGDAAAGGVTGVASRPGMVNVSVAQQQLIGVRTDVVQQSSSPGAVRTLGRIAPDASRVYRLIAATDGWVRELGRNPAGAMVKPSEALASYFVRDLVSAQQNYLYAYQTVAATPNQANVVPQRNSASLNLRLALDALRSLGMTDAEIEELQKRNQPSPELHLYAPAVGLVLARNISPGQRFDKGSELYRIADLSRVWVTADVFEKDREFVTPGAAATVRYGGREYRARMSDLLPEFDPQSRTLKARFELDNPGYALRPDMFVDVEMEAKMPAGISIPADAVLDSGRRKIAYVDRGNGLFEPRQIKTGAHFGDRVLVTEGLQPGERIVVSGSFLIDSESRLKAVPTEPTEPATEIASAKDPVCGMDIDPTGAHAIRSQHGGRMYAFCSPKCKHDFDAEPGKYAAVAQP